VEGLLGAVTSLAFAPDGKTLASGSTAAYVRTWDVTDFRK
jgi:WD40 repeat protein